MPTDLVRSAGSRSALSDPILYLLLFSVLAAPAALGAVDAWVWSTQALLAGIALATWAAHVALGHPPTVALRRLAVPASLFTAALAWASLQASGWSPAAWHHPLWPMAAETLGTTGIGAVSLAPTDTSDAILRLCGYAAVFYLAVNLCRDRRRARLVLAAVAVMVTLYAAYGIAAHLSGAERILWMAKTSYHGDLTATFVNRNTFGAFAGLGFLCLVGLLCDGLGRTARGVSATIERRRLMAEFMAGRGALLLGAMFVVGTAILLTHSRAVLACTLAGSIVLLLALGLSGALSLRRTLAAVAAGAALLGVAFLAGDGTGTGDRLLQVGDHAETRMEIYRRTADAIADSPWLGTGLGTFAQGFRLYRSQAVAAPFTEAHDTYLETVMELGLPAGLALILAVASLPALCVLGLIRRRRGLAFPAVGLAASTLVGLHAMVDYSIQNPAVAALYALIMGAACAQCWSSRVDTGR